MMAANMESSKFKSVILAVTVNPNRSFLSVKKYWVRVMQNASIIYSEPELASTLITCLEYGDTITAIEKSYNRDGASRATCFNPTFTKQTEKSEENF